MGNRLVKPPPINRPFAPVRGGNAQIQRPFPALTPQSYLPNAGVGGFMPSLPPFGGANNFPMIGSNSFLPQQPSMEMPLMNFNGGPGMLQPPTPFPMPIPPQIPFQPPMPFQNPNMMSAMGPPMYDPGFSSYPRRRSMRVCRPRRRRSRRCRPVVHVIESDSCSSDSSYSTISSCSRRRRRSRSRSRRCAPSQPQQPIILLPIQSATAPAGPVQAQIQQQPQQIILPPIQVQQQGQLQQQQQQLALPIQQFGSQIQQQPFSLAPLQISPSNLIGGINSNPTVIASGQPMLQPSLSFPQIANLGQPQQIQGGAIQYVQAAPRSPPSPLQYVSSDRRSVVASQRALVNSTNKKQPTRVKPVARSHSTRDFPQSDLKHGRRPFDWYGENEKKKVVNENIRLGKRGSIYAN